jgi:flagellar biosynthesis protein FliR
MVITGAEITGWVGSILWPFFRISAMLMTMPVVGSKSVPTQVRMMMALAISLVLLPLVPAVPEVDLFSWDAIAIIIQQIFIGIVMGFIFQLVFAVVITAGQIIAMQMGLGFASMVDPQNGAQVPVLAQVYLLMTTLLFLGVDGHLVLIQIMGESFQVIPIGSGGIDADGYYQLAMWGSQLFASALWVALPALASLLIINLAFGVMARAAPQLNIFSVGFPVAVMMGYFVLWVTLPVAVEQFGFIMADGFDLLNRVIVGDRP